MLCSSAVFYCIYLSSSLSRLSLFLTLSRNKVVIICIGGKTGGLEKTGNSWPRLRTACGLPCPLPANLGLYDNTEVSMHRSESVVTVEIASVAAVRRP